jgi:hypothetical protein
MVTFELNNDERELISRIRNGISEIRIYKAGLYPTVVSFALVEDELVTIRAREAGVAPRFEVFPISATAEVIRGEPNQVVDCKSRSNNLSITLLRKAEWSVPTSAGEKAILLGDPKGSTTQTEGLAADIPSDALNSAVLDAGIEIRDPKGWSFQIATSMFPFALYVSNCDFSEDFDPAKYERQEIS